MPRVDNLAQHMESASRPIGLRRGLLRCLCATVLLLSGSVLASTIPRDEPTVDELKARVSSASVGDKAKLCTQIAEKQLAETDKLYASDNVEQAQTTLGDVVTFSELARDYSIQSHKHEKQIEISVRSMTRKLTALLHTLGHNEQEPVRNAITHLERVRDDLLGAMFPKGAK